ncbi:uncharacterized protein LOC142015620 [Carettochelys insculpta]|uniref:uncharacterized protein LOC142015620 n=1 Tax=Carettochelys insculpta TaxID=44489 RepID=UPI003EBBD09B
MQRTGSPIATETDMDLTAALLPSGGTRSHPHALQTAVSETGALPALAYQGPFPPTARPAKPHPGAQPGASCRLWNVPHAPASCPAKGLGQSTLPFSFGTSTLPPPQGPRLALRPGKLPVELAQLGCSPGLGTEPGRCGSLKGLDPEHWEGPKPGLDKGLASASALAKLPGWDGCSRWAEALLCPVQPGQDVSPAEVRPGPVEEPACGLSPPSAALSLPGGSTMARRAESAGPGCEPQGSETAAEPPQDDGLAWSQGAEEPMASRDGAQDSAHSASPVGLRSSAVAAAGSGLACCLPPEPGLRAGELPLGGPGWTEEEAEGRWPQGAEPGQRPGARSSVSPAGPGCESTKANPPETGSQAQRARGLRPASASAPAKTSVEDTYGRVAKACGLSLLEQLRKTFLDAEGGCFSLLDSGLVLGRVEAHAALGLAVLPMRDGRRLATTLPSCSLFLYYALGRQFYTTEKLADCWFRARDRITGQSMLVKKVPVVSDWRKMLHNFLFLPPHPALLVPYAVLYDRNDSILYLMEDRAVRTVGRPPGEPSLETPQVLREVLSFLNFCKRHGFHPGDVGTASIYTAQGLCFDPSSLSSSEDPYAFRKSTKALLRPLLAQQQGLAGLDSLVDSMCQDLEAE